MVSLNFNRADLVEIVHILAQHLRLTYTIDPEVKGTVTIHSAEPLRSEDLLPIFHQVLRMNGAVAVRTGNIYRIMPIKDAKGLVRPAGQSREDSFALQVVPVRFFAAAEMKKLLTAFLTPGGELIEYPRGNFLIAIDLPSNIQRLVEIAEMIDVQVFAGTRMEIYQPRVASAEELAAEMAKVMQSYASSAAQPENFASQFIALPRINQLLVISHSEAAWVYAKRWLDRLDVVGEGPGRRIFIYPVENGKATELAEVLSQALGHATTGARAPSQTLQSLHRSTPGGFGQSGSGRTPTAPFGASSGSMQQQSQPLGGFATIPVPGQAPPAPLPGTPPGLAPVPGPARPGAPASPASPGAPRQEEQLRIVPDSGTNSLIIYGTLQEFQNIRNILKSLDIIPRQVLMDVMVLEVTLADDLRFGIDYEIMRKGGDVRIFNREFGSRGGILSGITPGAAPAGLTSFGLGLSGVIGTGNAIRAFVNALATDSRVRVLSHPSVLATDNRPARIQVGTEEPVPTGTITQTVGTIAESTTIQYRNTGRIVTIIPQVNSQGLVNLQILAEVSQRGANVTVGPNTFPSFDIRQAETTAVVQDGESLVIGGIISERKVRDRTGVPYLMNLPVLGRLFGTTIDEVGRTELIMLITPNVIRNRDEGKVVTEEFKRKLSGARSELERYYYEQEKLRESAPEPALPKNAPAEPGRRSSTPEKSNKGTARGTATADRVPDPPVLPPVLPPVSKNPLTHPEVTRGGGTTAASHGAAKPAVVRELTSPPRAVPVQSAAEPLSAADMPSMFSAVSQAAAPPQVERPPVAQPRASHGSGVPAKSTPSSNGATKENGRKGAGVWMVQVASVPEEKLAGRIHDELRQKGYDAYLSTARAGSRLHYRVRVGKLSTKEEAVHLQEILKVSDNIDDTFVTVVYPQ